MISNDRPNQNSEDFESWWMKLEPPGYLKGVPLDKETAQTVWTAKEQELKNAFNFLEQDHHNLVEALELRPIEEIAFIADFFHNGCLSYPLEKRMDWHAKNKDIRR